MARTRTPTGNEDRTFFRCKRCNFVCNTDRDKTGDGEGVTLVLTTEGTNSYYDPQHRAGCPFCNTKNYKNWQR